MTREEYRSKMIEYINIYHELENMSQNLRERTYRQLLDSLDAEYRDHCSANEAHKPELSLAELVGRIRPSSNLDITTAIIYYKTIHEKLSAVKQDDISAAYTELQRTPPASLVQNLRELASAKYDSKIVFRGGFASIAEEGRKFIKGRLEAYERDVCSQEVGGQDVSN